MISGLGGLALASKLSSFISREHMCRFAIRANGKGDTARADSVFALCLVRERVPIIVLHWERLILRTLHIRETTIFLDDGDDLSARARRRGGGNQAIS